MKKIFLPFLLAIVCTSQAATYYASPEGNGDGNSINNPCSFSNGIKKLSTAGDTLYLLSGQYDLQNTKIQNLNGTAQKRIVISGYEGITRGGTYSAILDFRTVAYGTRGLQVASSCSYLHIKNLTLRYSGKNNLYNEGSYCLFENLDIYGSGDTGCQMKNGGGNIIKNVDSHDNFDYQTMSGNTANFGGNADGFADKQFTGAGNTYIGCRAWNNSDDGWDFFQRVSNSKTVIENCICYINGAPYYNMQNHPRYQTDRAWFDSKVGTQMTDRYGNTITITLAQYPNQGNGNGFKMGGNYTNHLVEVHHCLAVGNYERGFDQNNNAGTMWVYNCTAYANKYNYGFTTAYGTSYLRNCVSFRSANGDTYSAQTVGANDHNTWNNGFSVSAADFVSLDTTQILTYRQGDGSLNVGTLLHLSAGSELIDAGAILDYLYTGEAPDLGCYEIDGVLHPSVVCTSDNSEQWIMAGDSIQPIVFRWGGSATRLTCTGKPDGITHKISNNNKTLTLSGAPTTAGNHHITVTTVSDDNESASLQAVLHVKPQGLHRVAFVTTPGASEDEAILQWLNESDSITVQTLDAANGSNDYSTYDVIVLGPKPNSGAAAYIGLKGYNKPMLCLKPFLFKNTVWNWGTAANTSDLAISVKRPSHSIFTGLGLAEDNSLTIFDRCVTNAVTSLSSWTGVNGTDTLASPVSQPGNISIAELPAGTDCNGTVLTQPLLLLGISEYSTAYLNENGKRLVENAIYYLLGLPVPTNHTTGIDCESAPQTNNKVIRNGNLQIILPDGRIFNALGQRVK